MGSLKLGWFAAGLLAAGCGRPVSRHQITVIGSDNAFSVADTVPAGPALVHYRYRGAVPHEMILGRLREGTPPSEFADSLAHDRSLRPLLDGGTAVLFGTSGQPNYPFSVAVNLIGGRHYAVWCQFSNGPDQPRHLTLGMFKILSVRPDAGRQ